jgi:hypothetical protein
MMVMREIGTPASCRQRQNRSIRSSSLPIFHASASSQPLMLCACAAPAASTCGASS